MADYVEKKNSLQLKFNLLGNVTVMGKVASS